METPTSSRSPQILKWSLIIGIVIVLNLFYNYTLSLVYSAPEYNTFCPQTQLNVASDTQESCIASGGAWTQYPSKGGAQVAPINGTSPTSPAQVGYCDQSFSCNQKFQDVSKIYDRNVFITLIVLGVLTFVASLLVVGFELLSSALSIGAVLDFIVASVRYWSRADDLIKVFILGLALAVLVWISIKRFNISERNAEPKN